MLFGIRRAFLQQLLLCFCDSLLGQLHSRQHKRVARLGLHVRIGYNRYAVPRGLYLCHDLKLLVEAIFRRPCIWIVVYRYFKCKTCKVSAGKLCLQRLTFDHIGGNKRRRTGIHDISRIRVAFLRCYRFLLDAGNRVRVLGIHVIEKHNDRGNFARSEIRPCVDILLVVGEPEAYFGDMICSAALICLPVVAGEVASRPEDIEPRTIAVVVVALTCRHLAYNISLLEYLVRTAFELAKEKIYLAAILFRPPFTIKGVGNVVDGIPAGVAAERYNLDSFLVINIHKPAELPNLTSQLAVHICHNEVAERR